MIAKSKLQVGLYAQALAVDVLSFKRTFVYGALPEGSPIGGDSCRHRPSEPKMNALHQLVRFRTEATIIFQHHVVHVLEKMGGLKPSSQRRASWQRAECDMI